MNSEHDAGVTFDVDIVFLPAEIEALARRMWDLSAAYGQAAWAIVEVVTPDSGAGASVDDLIDNIDEVLGDYRRHRA